MAVPLYSVTLHHLAPGAKAAGLAYPDEQLLNVTNAQLQDLLFSLGEVATTLTIYEPAIPEIRIKTDRDVFIIRTRYRRLCFVGWETILRGEDHSVGYILSTVTGTAEPVKVAPKVERTLTPTGSTPPVDTGRVSRKAKMAVLVALIIGFNATTAWMLLRPAPSLLPKHELLPDAESNALLTKVAGEYETGGKQGDRRLIIDPDGTLRLSKLGPKLSNVEERTKSARGALVDGRPVLITSDPNVLIIKDTDTVVLYGSIYRRHTR